MKPIFLLTIPSSLLCLSSIGAVKPVASQFVEFKTTSLHYDDTMSYMQVSVKASTDNPVYVTIYIVNDYYPDGIEISNLTLKTSTTKQISYDNEFTRPNSSIKLKYSVNKKTRETTTPVNVFSSRHIRINESPYTYSSSSLIHTYTPSGGWKTSNQNLTFVNFEDIYMPSYYHKIDLSSFKIQNPSSFPSKLNCSTVTLYITDPDGDFSSFKNEDGLAQFDLMLVKGTKDYYLAFEKDLYVNKNTLKMSKLKKTNCVKTKHLYFPINEKRNESKYECILKINALGIDYSDFISTFRYKTELNIIGDCHNSEFCVMNV